PHVGHALERHGRPRVGLAAAVRLLVAHQVRLVAGGLEVAEDALVDDGELRRLYAIVVVTHGAEGARRGSVADEGAMLARDPLADRGGRDVAGARIVGLVSQGAVELSRMCDAL